MSSSRRKSVLAINYGHSSNWEASNMWHRSLTCGAVVLVVLALSAAPASATLLSVDFGTGATQSGFNAMAATPATFPTAAGDITVTVSGQSGFFSRGNGYPPDSGAFTQGNLYQDFAYNNTYGGSTISVGISGIAANTDYTMTWYIYDWTNSNVASVTDQVAAKTGSNTTGSTGNVTFTTGDAAMPMSNGQYSYTGTWRSTSTSLDIDISYVSGGLPYTRVNGFEMTAVPEPSALVLLGTGFLGLLAYAWRKRK